MKNLTKTALLMSTILLMVAVPNAFANTVTEKTEYEKCKKGYSFPDFKPVKTVTKTSKTTLKVWDQGWSNYGDQPQFKLSYDLPKYLTTEKNNKCVKAWELIDIRIVLAGATSVNDDGSGTLVYCYDKTVDASENKAVEKTLSCNLEFRKYMNDDRDIYMSIIPSYVNLSSGAESSNGLEVLGLVAQAD